MPDYEFDDIEDLQRNRQLEADGVWFGIPGEGDRALKLAAATDANPRWRARGDKILREYNRLKNARVGGEELRRFMAKNFAETLGRDWRGFKARKVDIPYSVEALTALLVRADDIYSIVDNLVWDTINYRTEFVRTAVEQLKN